MLLKDLLSGLNYTLISGVLEKEINDIKYDSRKVLENDVYVSLVGSNTDGHEFIPEAISKKASVIIVSKVISIYGDVTVIKVDNTREFLAKISCNYFDNPAKKLTLIGITGTTGKTTSTHIVKKLLESYGLNCGLIGTIGIKYNDKIIPTNNTTPESYEIQKYLKEMLDNNITHVIIEASSQAFKMHRLEGINFDIGALTNITSDHIGPNEHANQEEYIECKKKLFLNSKKIIINNDSLYLDKLLENLNKPIISYSINNEADIKVEKIKYINNNNFIGTEFSTKGLINHEFKTSLPGLFNIYNVICAISILNELGLNLNEIKEKLIDLEVKGRMQTALITDKYKVIIDYAHTKDGMENLIKTIKAYNPKRLISIFGAGGNRAKDRRYNLGKIIGSASDLSILTMDNPRFEEISSINNDIKVGLDEVKAKYIEIDNREEAIKYACNNAQQGDIILLIGKGHEEYQDIKGIKYYFNELEILDKIKIE